MLTTSDKLAVMNSNKGSVLAFSGTYSLKWHCHVETDDTHGTKLTIKKAASTLDEAVDLAYETYCRIIGKAPELLRGLPAPTPADAQEADHMVVTDDIPF